MSYTKGPWKLNAGRAIETKDGTFTIHKCNDWNPEKIVELDQNAHLIAAATDLLEACKQVADQDDRQNGADFLIHITIMERIKSAIAKAEGREGK